MTRRTGQELYARARRIIPGGTQLLSKRPEMFLPDEWPAYYERASGAETWDLDGRCYVDMSHFGVGTCTLGFADPDVNDAVIAAVQAGTMSTLNCREDVELAELLLELHPWADLVRYARCGGEAMALAIRIARAASGRDVVAFCGYHGWHDWYLAANLAEEATLDGHLLAGLAPAGVPRGLAGTLRAFRYGRLDELETILESGAILGAIVLEPVRNLPPDPDFLRGVRKVADRAGAVLLFDEITSGWRINTGGIHLALGVEPDIAVFAKAMGNGYPMAAVIGTRATMEAAQQSFISSTYWTERIGPAAALATIRKHRRLNVPRHLVQVGEAVQAVWRAAARRTDLSIAVGGIPPLSHFSFTQGPVAAMTTLFTQEMLDRGFLASPQLYASYGHQPGHVERYRSAVEEAFDVIAAASRAGRVEAYLRGPVRHSGFQRVN
jgi:glutamate-1-semialdehyde 2,1-aminomutase